MLYKNIKGKIIILTLILFNIHILIQINSDYITFLQWDVRPLYLASIQWRRSLIHNKLHTIVFEYKLLM